MNNLIFFVVIFFQVILNINCQQFVPIGRIFHTATLVGTKIYFLGGRKTNDILTKDFFYLDISKSFNKTENLLPFVNLNDSDPTISVIPKHYGAASTVFGKSKDSIFFFGGDIGGLQTTSALAYSLDTQSLKWNLSITGSLLPDRRRFLSATADNNDKIYLFGGGGGGVLGDAEYKRYNIMNIFDNTNKIWINGTIINTLIGREGHTATFLSDTGEIIYIGGYNDNGLIDMTELDVYNTNGSTWNKLTTKNSPEPRYLHTAVLTNDNRIVVFGGANASQSSAIENYYVVLDIKNLEWYHGDQNLSTKAPFVGHTATLYNDYMFIVFGQRTNQPFSNDVLIYKIGDYANFTEVNDFIKLEKPEKPNMAMIIGVLIVLGIMCIIIIGLIIYWMKKQLKGKRPPKSAMSTPTKII